MNPKTGGVFASFGAHPSFEVAIEREYGLDEAGAAQEHMLSGDFFGKILRH